MAAKFGVFKPVEVRSRDTVTCSCRDVAVLNKPFVVFDADIHENSSRLSHVYSALCYSVASSIEVAFDTPERPQVASSTILPSLISLQAKIADLCARFS